VRKYYSVVARSTTVVARKYLGEEVSLDGGEELPIGEEVSLDGGEEALTRW